VPKNSFLGKSRAKKQLFRKKPCQKTAFVKYKNITK
jgi:hypothetical protein